MSTLLSLKKEILLHPNIPRPLHGVNPRTIKGKLWWDRERKLSYLKRNYRCWACRVAKQQARMKKWLEAHECYSFNYQERIATYLGTTALCHFCHNYIHDGRLSMLYQDKKITLQFYRSVISHGNIVLGKELKKVNTPTPIIKPNPFISSFPTNQQELVSSLTENWTLIIGEQRYTT